MLYYPTHTPFPYTYPHNLPYPHCKPMYAHVAKRKHNPTVYVSAYMCTYIPQCSPIPTYTHNVGVYATCVYV